MAPRTIGQRQAVSGVTEMEEAVCRPKSMRAQALLMSSALVSGRRNLARYLNNRGPSMGRAAITTGPLCASSI